jgi:ribosome-binding protein aMBF1 (putative translation factor)
MDGERDLVPEVPRTPETFQTPETREIPEILDTFETPDVLETLDISETFETSEAPGSPESVAGDAGTRLPVMPGFREMALRRRAGEQAARMAVDRGRLVRELAEQRQAAGLSQTEVAARMGTSQSAVARLESGTADVRASTLERYAAAVGGQIAWKLNPPSEGAS